MSALLAPVDEHLGQLLEMDGRDPERPVVVAVGLTRDAARWELAASGALPSRAVPAPVGLTVVVPGNPVALLAQVTPLPGTTAEAVSEGVVLRPHSCVPDACEWRGATGASHPATPAWTAFLTDRAAAKVHIDLRRWPGLAAAATHTSVQTALKYVSSDARGLLYRAAARRTVELGQLLAHSGRVVSDVTWSVASLDGLLVRQTGTLTSAGAAAYDAGRSSAAQVPGCDDAGGLCVSVPFSLADAVGALPRRPPDLESLRNGGPWATLYLLSNFPWALVPDLPFGLPRGISGQLTAGPEGLVGGMRFEVARPWDAVAPTTDWLGLPLVWSPSGTDAAPAVEVTLGTNPPPNAISVAEDDARIRFDTTGVEEFKLFVPGGLPLKDLDVADLRQRSSTTTVAISLHLRRSTGGEAVPVLHVGEALPATAPTGACLEAEGARIVEALSGELDEGPSLEAVAARVQQCADDSGETESAQTFAAAWLEFRAQQAAWAGDADSGVALARRACTLGSAPGCALADEIEEAAQQATAAPGPGEAPLGEPQERPSAPSAVNATLRRYGPRLRRCVERSAALDGRPLGPVGLSFTIGPDGSVTAIDVTAPPPLRRCLERTLGEMVFPPPTDGGQIEVTYPMVPGAER